MRTDGDMVDLFLSALMITGMFCLAIGVLFWVIVFISTFCKWDIVQLFVI
jgi:hypothetical protein